MLQFYNKVIDLHRYHWEKLLFWYRWSLSKYNNVYWWHLAGVLYDPCHYDDVIMGTMASQITRLTSVYSTVYSGADQRKHQSSASLAFVWGIHRGPVNSPSKWPVTRKMFPFDDVIIVIQDMVKWHSVRPRWLTTGLSILHCWVALVNSYQHCLVKIMSGLA